METRLERQRCTACGYEMDATTHAHENEKPIPGNVSMCLACGHLAIFDENLRMREPTPEEALELSQSNKVLEAQIARAAVVGDQIKRRRATGSAEGADS